MSALLAAPDARHAERRLFTSGVANEPAIGHRLQARFVSRSLLARLPGLAAEGRVLASFGRACIIEYGGSDLLALVAPQVGNGPLNAVMERIPDEWSALQPNGPVRVQGSVIQLGTWAVDLGGAETWEPCPDWSRLRAHSGAVLGRLGRFAEWVGEQTVQESLLGLCHDRRRPGVWTDDVVLARARGAAEALWAGWQGVEDQLRAGAARLAGLGSGLTPAGDDFALGTMVCAWIAHPNPTHYCETVAEVCSVRTTSLSRAFLWSGAAGELGASWHCFLDALDAGSDELVETAMQELLAFGHSSGADALAGFLWMGLRAEASVAGRRGL